jgi:NTE family protein
MNEGTNGQERGGGGRALVLGGGGVTGIAWEVGVLHGLAESGVDLTDATTTIGTSAGSAVAARLTTGTSLADAFAAQLAPEHGEVAARISPLRLMRLTAALAQPGSPERRLARLGRSAMAATAAVTPERRLEVIRARLGDVDWPDRDLRLTAVEAETGTFTVFDRTAGVALLDAVAASCAIPFTWPPVAIDGRHYIDGGMRSPANADLAVGAEAVVVIAPIPRSTNRTTAIPTQLAATGAARTAVVSPDAAARAAMGRNPLDPAKRAASAEAGRRQAAAVLSAVRAAWSAA